MKLTSLTPNIMVKNVNQTLDYYTQVLGFELVDTNPTAGVLEWGYVKMGEVGLMFQEETSLKKEYEELKDYNIGAALTFYIRVTKIKELYEHLQQKVKIIKALNKTFYGALEFALMDINGFILTFSESPNE